ncbi:hypothetical protein AB1K70_14570 [Bremerella sp. JC770]|uniref:hypothetical protein n=1 Tax=Bremerella sp. JC770 TaxID=3232137 RepID=UPI0034595E71
MTETEPSQSPFASPGISTNNSVQDLVGDEVYWALRLLQWVYIVMAAQLGSFIAVPIIGVMKAAILEANTLSGGIDALFFGWLVSLYLFSAYFLLRLMVVAKSNVSTMVINTLLALCPCIGLLALMSVAETFRESLERQGIPFGRTGPNWNALREMAADLPSGDDSVPTEDCF